jgi:DNA topoisomerase-1
MVVAAERAAGAQQIEDGATGDVQIDPVESARMAGLRYVTDLGPGIRRKRAGKHFSYVGVDGQPNHDLATLKRIKSLAIPPAWTDVWIAPTSRGHIQATGRDAKGRKQYRYHPKWRQARDETKFYRMLEFGRALPIIRARVKEDLARPGLPREKVLATVVKLLEATLIRVGNEEYARDNKHYGLTTMRNRHVDVAGSKVIFHFKGKSGIEHEVDVADRRLANIVKRLQDLPGHHLFQYVDEDGHRQDVDSDAVNAYLQEITGQSFTAKDFRTWAGTLLAAQALQEFESFDSETQARKNIVQAIERVAERLGNTPSVCRKCYVHPEIIDAYMEGTTTHAVRELVEQEMAQGLSDLSPEEAAVMALLQQRLKRHEVQTAT